MSDWLSATEKVLWLKGLGGGSPPEAVVLGNNVCIMKSVHACFDAATCADLNTCDTTAKYQITSAERKQKKNLFKKTKNLNFLQH